MRRLIIKLLLIIIFLISIYLIADVNYTNVLNDSKTIEIEVQGEVEKQGIFKLKLGSTFSDLLNEIKLTDSSDISNYSLNMPLYNKEIIVIRKKDNYKKISINSSTLEELMTLPGIGIVTASKIIEYREIHGFFNSVEEIMNVDGIGNKKYEKIKEYISI